VIRFLALVVVLLLGCGGSPPPKPPSKPEPAQARPAWASDLEAGQTALRDGRFDAAEDHLLAALRLAEQHAKEDRETLAKIHFALGSLYTEHRRIDLALPHLEAALGLDRERLGPDHAVVIEDMEAIAIALDLSGQHADAERRFRDVLTRRHAMVGPDHVDFARAQMNLAVNLGYQNRYPEAETFYQRALVTLQRRGERVYVAEVLNGLGTVHFHRNELREARAYFERALGMRERFQGRNHPQVATVLISLCGVEMAEGRWLEAEQACGRAVAIRERTLPRGHPFLRAAVERHIQVLHKRGKPDEAAKLEELLAPPPPRR
jgi:serine/threonine-protein kinase